MELLSKGYGMIPNNVLFDKDLKDKTKLVYVVVSSLCAEKWYCRASNGYIWEQLWVAPKTIQRSVQELIDKWYLKSEIEKNKGNERHLSLWKAMDKNDHTYGQNCPYPMDKNVHIIIQDNILYITSYDDIKEIVEDKQYRSDNNKLLKCLIKLVDGGFKIEKKESEVRKFVEWLKEKAEIYNYKLPNWSIAEWELYQVFDEWYEYHKDKLDVSNHKSSVLTFLKNHKRFNKK